MIRTLPLVSVVVLTYKNFEGLDKTLKSILDQSYENIEIIIADDGSADYLDKEDEIKAFLVKNRKDNISSIVYKHEAVNVGTVKNCNNAICLSHGKYIKFISPDDEFYDENVLENCVSCAEKRKSRILVGQTFQKRRDGYDKDVIRNTPIYRWIARGGRKATVVPSDIDILRLQSMSEEECRYVIMTQTVISTVAVFFTKELLEETGGFNEKYCLIEDMPYWPTIAKNGVKFDFVNLMVMKYSMSGISNQRDIHSHSPFELERRDIIQKYYIANMKKDSAFNRYKKNLREQELKLLDIRGLVKLRYLDVMFVRLIKNIEFLFTGSRL